MIASGYRRGELIAWDADTTIEARTDPIHSLDVSPDSAVLATGSLHKTTNLWSTKRTRYPINSLDFSPDGAVLAIASVYQTKVWSTEMWLLQGTIECAAYVTCIRFSPSGEHLAIATFRNIQIWKPGTRKWIASFDLDHATIDNFPAWNNSLVWTPDGTRLLSGGDVDDPTIREWDASTWKQVGHPWKGHTDWINAIAINPAGTLVASASDDNCVRLWRLSDRRTITTFRHSDEVFCVTFSTDGKHILSGGGDKKISQWSVPEHALREDTPKEQTSKVISR